MKSIDTSLSLKTMSKGKQVQYRKTFQEECNRIGMKIIEFLIEEEVTTFEANLILDEFVKKQIEECYNHYPIEKLTEKLFNKPKEGEEENA